MICLPHFVLLESLQLRTMPLELQISGGADTLEVSGSANTLLIPSEWSGQRAGGPPCERCCCAGCEGHGFSNQSGGGHIPRYIQLNIWNLITANPGLAPCVGCSLVNGSYLLDFVSQVSSVPFQQNSGSVIANCAWEFYDPDIDIRPCIQGSSETFDLWDGLLYTFGYIPSVSSVWHYRLSISTRVHLSGLRGEVFGAVFPHLDPPAESTFDCRFMERTVLIANSNFCMNGMASVTAIW